MTELKAEIDDTSAFGIPHHDHSKHRVSVRGLNYQQAKELQQAMDNYIMGERQEKGRPCFLIEVSIFDK